MSKKRIACPRGRSVSVDEPGVPQLCRACWDRARQRIRVGASVVFTEDDTSRGVVRKIVDGNIAAIGCDECGEAWIPTSLLVAVTT